MKKTSIVLITLTAFASCTTLSKDENKCVKGKFIDTYCSGYVIQILDNSVKGKEWEGSHNGKLYKNSLVASFDTTIFTTGTHPDPLNTELDSIFYFKFREGGYPRQEFNICEPSPFITITYTSPNPCLEGYLE